MNEVFRSWEQIEARYFPRTVAERRTAEQTARELGEWIAREALNAIAAAMAAPVPDTGAEP